MVKDRLLEPPSGMLGAPNALLMLGGATTVILALEVFPAPVSAAVTCTLLLFVPAVAPLTLTESVHVPPAARVPPVRLTELDPSAAVTVPPQVLVTFPGVATTRPAGKLSTLAKPTPVN